MLWALGVSASSQSIHNSILPPFHPYIPPSKMRDFHLPVSSPRISTMHYVQDPIKMTHAILKKETYRDRIKRKGDKIGMGYMKHG